MRDGAGAGRQQAHQGAQRGGLAGAVAADQRHPAAGRHVEGDVAQHPDAGDVDGDALELKHAARDPDHVPLHHRVRQHLGRRAEGGDPPLAPDRDAVGEAGDHVHVVLDEDRGDAGLAQHPDQGLDDLPSSPPRRRRWWARPSAAGAAAAPRPWRCRPACGRPRSAHRRGSRRRPPGRSAPAGPSPPPARPGAAGGRSGDQRPRREATASAAFSSTVCSVKSCGSWKLRPMPRRTMARGCRPRIGWPSNSMRAGLRPQVAGRHVDEGGLAGAVGPDDGEELARHDIEVDAVGRLHAAEGQPQALAPRAEGRAHAPRPFSLLDRMPQTPPGANRITSSSTPPRIICQASATAAAA